MNKHSEGLTLVEILVTITIIGIAFTALAFAQVSGFGVTRSSLEQMTARDLASKRIELIQSYGYAFYKGCPTTGPGVTGIPGCSGSETPNSNPGFTLTWSVTKDLVAQGIPDRSPEDPALVGVNVRVAWQDKSYSLYTYLSCADAGDFSTTNVTCPDKGILQ